MRYRECRCGELVEERYTTCPSCGSDVSACPFAKGKAVKHEVWELSAWPPEEANRVTNQEPPDRPTDEPDKEKFLGRRVAVYLIDKFLGEGSLGYVYRARDTNLDIDVALKILKPAFAHDEVFEENFRREAHRAAKFRHPNVIAIHYVGKDGDVVFFSMDLLETGLKDLMFPGKPMHEAAIAKIGMDVASALQRVHTHEGGLVHRNIKPSHIRFHRDGNAVLTGFGIAEAATDYTADIGTTVYTTVSVGTPEYMSPEQGLGHRVGRCSDIYSLGVTLYEMATGEAPFAGRDWFELARKHNEKLPTPPREKNPELDPDLERIILRCLEKDPAHRYQSAEELRAELARRTPA
jgi:serine/threonine protein kinase